ncbi:MAG TPA: response regulator [Opitutaceae bacterium]|nr:response regulator [Opitutaceae bacterium]
MSPAATNSRLLIVDDDEGMLILMAESLRAENYVVDTASNVESAQHALTERSPDLMLLDLKLRDAGGVSLIKRLKRDDAPVPFLIVTGQGDEKIAAEVMKHGALDYVMKDTALLDLLPAVVKRALTAVQRDRELAEAQARLRESEARLSNALRATNDGVWEWRIQEERIYFSARWKANLGYEPHEIPDELDEWRKRVHPADRARLQKAEEEFFASQRSTFQIEYRLLHKNGDYRWIALRAFLERDSKGAPSRLTGADADITEQKILEKEILRISDREQWRIGQELHDGLGQQLTAIELMCESLRTDLSEKPELAAEAGKMSEFLRHAITQTRALSHGLTPFMLSADGLQAALEEMASRVNSLRRVKCEFICPTPVVLKDSEASGHLFRLAQEAINNALKHAGATHVAVSLHDLGDGIELKVADDGRGLPKANRRREGMGLQVMRHRANAIGAELKITSNQPKGVTVICVLRK